MSIPREDGSGPALTLDERIAALLDGRLSAAEMAALLEEIGPSDEDLERLVDSAGIAAEMEEQDRDPVGRCESPA